RDLVKESRRNRSAPRVIRTPDLLIRRTVLACQHPITIGHSTAHKPTNDRRNSACPSEASGGPRDASAPHVAGRFATALQPGRGVFGVALPPSPSPDLLIRYQRAAEKPVSCLRFLAAV